VSPVNSRLFQLQEMRQEMRINPRLYQSMELLYMPLLDLQKHLESELEENPFLELTESDSGEEPDQKSSTEDVEVEVSVGKGRQFP
jgi:RNA polymerase sigma-54 factor